MKNYCFIGLILISFVPSVLAADLKIGSLILSTGMEQADIMEDLRSHFHIVRVPGAKSMFFVSQDKDDRTRPIVSLAFENGRVSWIERNWGTFSGRISPVEVTKALLSAIESAKTSSGSSAVINTSVKNSHGAEFKSVHFVFLTVKSLWLQQMAIPSAVIMCAFMKGSTTMMLNTTVISCHLRCLVIQSVQIWKLCHWTP